MRVTELGLAQQAAATIDADLARIAQLNQEIAAGSTVADPSADPAAAGLVLQAQEQAGLDQQGQKTAAFLSPRLDQEVQVLGDASRFLTQARTLLVLAQNGTVSSSDRQAIAAQLEGILESLVGLANQRAPDRYLFSGTASSQPFQQSGLLVSYQGDFGTVTLSLGPGAPIVVHEPGAAIFLAQTDQATGTPQPAGPLGLSGSFTVNGQAVTVSPADSVSSIAAKINAATGAGARATVTPANALVISSLSTAPLSLADTSGTPLQSLGILTATGAIANETLPSNLFDALIGAIQDLQGGNIADLAARLAEMDAAQDTLGAAQSFFGSQQGIAVSMQTTLGREQTALQAAASQAGGADLPQAAVQYQAAVTAYQASLGAALAALRLAAGGPQGLGLGGGG